MMPITHKWNGTVLTITSDSGTSSADLKGAKGDDGARGAQGIAGVVPSLDEYAKKEYVDDTISDIYIRLNGYYWRGEPVQDSYALSGKPIQYFIRNRNLLDNSYWMVASEIVNQRGKTTYSGAVQYTIDRWKTTNANTTLEVENNYIRLTNTTAGSGGYLQQTLEDGQKYLGKTLTLAVMLEDGTIVVNSATLPTAFQTSIQQYATLSVNSITVGAIQVSNNAVWVRIWSNANENSRAFKWACLYEGAYTADTLPVYLPKGYGAELVECQRFYRRTNAESTYATIGIGYARTATMAWIHLPRTRMRIGKPSITITGKLIAYCGSGSNIPVSSVEMEKISDNYVRFKVNVESGFTAGYPVLLASETDTNVYIEENADL